MANFSNSTNCEHTVASDYTTSVLTNKSIWFSIIDSLSIILMLSGFLINLLFIVLSIRGVRLRLFSFKLFIFLINRSTCDCVACLFIIILRILIIAQFLPDIDVQLISAIFDIAYIVNCFTNIALSLMRLIVVKWPIKAHIYLSERRCVMAIVLCWILAISTVLIMFFVVIRNIRGNKFCQNSFETCILVAEILWIIITGTSYLSVMIIFGITAYYVHRSNRTSPSSDVDVRRHQSKSNSLRRLFIGVIIFLVCNCLEVPTGYLMLSSLSISRRAAENAKNNFATTVCLTNADTQYLIISYTFSLAWTVMIFIRMTVDPLVNIISDSKMRKMISNTKFCQMIFRLFQQLR